MPEIGVVQKPGLFEDLLRRLGVNRPMRPFTLDGNILPVVLVESGVAFVAAPTPAYTIPDIFTAGTQVAPAAGFVLADTGPLAIGFYTYQVVAYTTEDAELEIQFRDSANGATLRTILVSTDFPQPFLFDSRFAIENTNERIRVVNPNAGTAGKNYTVTILAKT